MRPSSGLHRRPGSRPLAGVTLLLAVVLALTAFYAPAGAADPATPTIPARAVEPDLERRDAPIMPARCFAPAQSAQKPGPCYLRPFKAKRPTVVLWGDSHAYMYVPALLAAAERRRINVVTFVAGSCPPVYVPIARRYAGKCEQNNAIALRFVSRLQGRPQPLKVVIGSNWSGFRRAYRDLFLERVVPLRGYTAFTKRMVRLAHRGTPALFTQLARRRVSLTVLGQAAVVPDLTAPCAAGEDPYHCDVPRFAAIPEERATERYVRAQLAKTPARKRYVDTTRVYCTATVCHGKVGSVATWFDQLHLSATRTRTMGRFLRTSLDDLR